MSLKVALTDLPRVLRAEHGVETNYFACWRSITDGRIPAVKVKGCWYIWRDHLPAVAATLARRTRTAA